MRQSHTCVCAPALPAPKRVAKSRALFGFGLALAALGLATPASARQVALVIRDAEAAKLKGASDDTMRALSELLWAYGVEVIDTSRIAQDRVPSIMPEFERKLEGTDIALLYYVGVARTGAERTTILAPGSAGTQGNNAAPLVVQSLLDSMRAKSKRSVAMLDVLKRRGDIRQTRDAELPGLSGIKAVADTQLVSFTNTFVDQAGTANLPMTSSLMRQLQGDRQQPIRLTRLASLVKEEVMFETGNLYVPWVVGSLPDGIELRRAPDAEVRTSKLAALGGLLSDKKCPGANSQSMLQSAVGAHFANEKRQAPSDLTLLASADLNDMMWILRNSTGLCPLPPFVRPETARTPPQNQQQDNRRQQQQAAPRNDPQPQRNAERAQQPRQQETPASRREPSAPSSGGGRSFAPGNF